MKRKRSKFWFFGRKANYAAETRVLATQGDHRTRPKALIIHIYIHLYSCDNLHLVLKSQRLKTVEQAEGEEEYPLKEDHIHFTYSIFILPSSKELRMGHFLLSFSPYNNPVRYVWLKEKVIGPTSPRKSYA